MEEIEQLITLAERNDQNDLAVGMEQIVDIVEQQEGGELDTDEMEDALEDVRLPFYEVDRELAFVFGIHFGGIIEAEYGGYDAE